MNNVNINPTRNTLPIWGGHGTITLVLLLITCLCAVPAKSQTIVTNILYQDNFSSNSPAGGTALNGWTPDTVDAYVDAFGSTNHTWIATGWVLDGSGDAVIQNGLNDAFLPFVPLPGRVYTLSAGLECVSGSWVALGFAGSDNTTAYFALHVGAVGWQLCNSTAGTAANSQQTFVGPNTLGQVNIDVSYSGIGTYATVLDTRPANPANWTFTFLVNGAVAVPAQAFGGTGPVINYVGIGNGNASDNDLVQTFTLTEQATNQPPFISVQPQPPAAGTNFPGDTVVLSVSAGGYPGPFYQWRFNSTNISGATGSSLLLSSLTTTNAGSYTVVVSSGGLSVTSTPVAVAVQVPLTNTIYLDTFSGTSGPLNGRSPDTTGTNAQWIAAASWIAGFNGTTNEASVSGDAGPNAYLPFVPLPGQVYYLSAILEDQSGGSWLALGYSGADGTGGTFNQGTSVGWLIARDDGDPQPNQYFIGPGTDGGSAINGDYSSGPASYTTVLDTRPANSANWTFFFETNGVPVSLPTAFGGSGPSISYVGMGVGGSDSVTAQNFSVVALSEPVKPYITTSPQGGTYYVGQSLTLSSIGGGAFPFNYQWQLNSTNIPGATASTLTFSNLVVTNTGSYRLIVGNTLGTATSSPAMLIVSTAPTQVTVASNLVLHLEFNGNYLDSSGRGNNATNEGSATEPGIVGGAMSYGDNGSTPDMGYAVLGNPSDLLFSNNVNFSISYWIQYTNVPDNEMQGSYPPLAFPNCDLPIIGCGVGATYAPGWVIAQGGEGCENNPGAFVWTLNDTSDTIAASGPAHSEDDGNWHHLVHVFDWVQGFGTTYLDGNKVDATSIVGLRTVDQPNPITIGQDPTGAYNSAGAANLSDLAIWRRALSANEARSIYAAGISNHVSLASLPLPLAATVSSGQLHLTWSVGVLQQASSITGPWTTVTNATTPSYSVPVTGAIQFYRAQQ